MFTSLLVPTVPHHGLWNHIQDAIGEVCLAYGHNKGGVLTITLEAKSEGESNS